MILSEIFDHILSLGGLLAGVEEHGGEHLASTLATNWAIHVFSLIHYLEGPVNTKKPLSFRLYSLLIFFFLLYIKLGV